MIRTGPAMGVVDVRDDPGRSTHVQAAPAARDRGGPLLTADEVAERLGVHADTVRRAFARGELPGLRLAGAYRLFTDDLERWFRTAPARRAARTAPVPDAT